MKRHKLGVVGMTIILLSATAAKATTGQDSAASQLNADLGKLKEMADAFPPRIETPEQRAEAEALWRSVEKRLLEKRQASPGDFRTELQLGDCYRMGHNLDIEGAWDKAVVHLQEAARLDPASAVPPTLLGQHYAGSGRPAEAEKQLLSALSLSGGNPPPAVHFFLAFTYYQLGQFEKVVPHATEYLESDPASPAMTLMKDRAEASIRGEPKPQTVVIEPKKEVGRDSPLPGYQQPSFSTYYLDPRPDRVPALIAEFQKEGALALGHMTAAGFLSQVFRDNPDRLDEWVPAIRKLEDSEREYVWLAVWFAGTKPAMKLLRDAVQKEKEAVSKSIAVLDRTAPPLTEIPIQTGQHLDLLWGAFFATGRPEYIARIIECLPWTLKNPQENALEFAIGRAAEWSLLANAREHPRVLAICKSELEKQTGDTRQLLSKLILEASRTPE